VSPMTTGEKIKRTGRKAPSLLAAAGMVLAVAIAGCGGSGKSYAPASGSPPAAHGSGAPASAAASGSEGKPSAASGEGQKPPAASTASQTPAAGAENTGIPRHNGGDQDADNNGGPSDGDGNV
jgi:hypothetical protein